MQCTCRRNKTLAPLARNLLHLGRSPLRVRHLPVDLHLAVQLLRAAPELLLRLQLPRLAQSELRAHRAYLHARESLDGSTVVGWCPWCPYSRWLEPFLHGSREARLEPLLRASPCSVYACSVYARSICACCVRALLLGCRRPLPAGSVSAVRTRHQHAVSTLRGLEALQ